MNQAVATSMPVAPGRDAAAEVARVADAVRRRVLAYTLRPWRRCICG